MVNSKTQKREMLDEIAEAVVGNLKTVNPLKTGNDIVHVLLQAVLFLHKNAGPTGRTVIEQSVRNLMIALYKAE